MIRPITFYTATLTMFGYLTKEEALFLLSLIITVLQLIYDFYKTYLNQLEQLAEQKKRVQGGDTQNTKA